MCCRMREEEERIMVKTYLGVAHGRANFGTGRAIFLGVLWFGLGTVWHGRATILKYLLLVDTKILHH